MTVSEWAAWWGAVIATAVLIWDVYKWRNAGAKVRVSTSPNMQYFNPGAGFDDRLHISVEAVNNGDRATTITHCVIKVYKNRFDYLRRKTSMLAVVTNPSPHQPIPHVLEPGGRWNGMIDQENLKEEVGAGLLYCGIHHTAKKKAQMVRVII